MATVPPSASPASPKGNRAHRAYRANCPNCGAQVEFASAASASAVCSFCRSTLVRDGEALRRVGVSAELFDDHSPLQLGVSGTRQGIHFVLVGRLQYGYEGGTWNEWHALFDAAGGERRSSWLSEDNGAYVLAFDSEPKGELAQANTLQVGGRLVVDGRAWDVASIVRAKLIAAQGELPRPPTLEREFLVADLRNAQGEVGTLDYSGADSNASGAMGLPRWSSGRTVLLSELALQGLREGSEKTLSSRGIECPSCGAALEVKLSTTQAITCHQCHAVVDVSKGVGAELSHYAQNNSGSLGTEPQLPLGSTGVLALDGEPLPWQVVGYMERCDLPAPGASGGDDEQSFWREYLLYHPTAGFAFLVDANDGWSWVRPLTGAPQQKGGQALWQGSSFQRREGYRAKVTWVQGEFYWRVKRDELAEVVDYTGTGAASKKRLSREQVTNEVTWSVGEVLDAAVVADAFNLPAAARAALARDVVPGGLGSLGGITGRSPMVTAIVLLVVFLVVASMVTQCGQNGCDSELQSFGGDSLEYQQCLANNNNTNNTNSGSGMRTGGGSYGGYSSGGGGHK